MNQIPNIEDGEWVWIKEDRWHQTWLHKEHGERQINTELLNFILHQQLQKARHNWLREEIVKLEGIKVTKNELDQAKYSNGNPVQRPEIKQLMEWVNHRTLQTIIDRYQAELDQDITN